MDVNKNMHFDIKYGILEIQIEDHTDIPQCCGAELKPQLNVDFVVKNNL